MRERITRVVREDLRDLERVREISLVEQLVDLLPAKVGAPLSIKSRVKTSAYQVHLGTRSFANGKTVVLPFTRFCTELRLP